LVLRATLKPFCEWRTLASYLKRVEETMYAAPSRHDPPRITRTLQFG
jgi:hypothetical protein